MITAGPTHALVLEVNLHEPRFHGRPEWPPSPARLFQALVAGASSRLGEPEVVGALRWLEEQEPPVIAAPRPSPGQAYTVYVPNNDLDAAGGDPAAVASLRVGKTVAPRLLQPDVPFLFGWRLDEADTAHAGVIIGLAEGLFQLGRGVDPAWARGAIVEAEALDDRLAAHPGVVHRPGGGGGGALPCPRAGTLDSLRLRHAAQGRRFRVERVGRKPMRVFRQPPKALFRDVTYGGGAEAVLFDLRPPGAAPGERFRGRLERVHDLVVAIRDGAAARLREQLPERAADIDAVIVGRRPGEAARVPASQRVRIVPLPSIGHAKVDRAPRRVLVQFPQGGPLRPGDLRWAFSGLSLGFAVLTEARDVAMRERYAGTPSRTWRSVTPVVLPERAARRRIEPTRIAEEVKGAEERALEEAHAAEAVVSALRHAGVSARLLHVGVQREPWSDRGLRVEAFAEGTRFAKERLWHVAITLDRRVQGPLVIGDGRFLGLGLLVPEKVEARSEQRRGELVALRVVSGMAPSPDPEGLARALRRAVMARVQGVIGPRRTLPLLFSGHEEEGGPARGHRHLGYQLDAARERLILHVPGERAARDRARLDEALDGMTELRAGAAGRLTLVPEPLGSGDPLLAASRRWTTVTPYEVRRHAKKISASEAVERDVRDACRAAGLPDPARVEVRGMHAPPGRGRRAHVTLTFAAAIPGPVLLGRTAHLGGGLFEGAG